MMIVQLRISGDYGSEDEITERDDIAEAIDIKLQQRGCGSFDGRDTGGGATNLFFCNIPEAGFETAVEIAVHELRLRGAANRAIIARSVLIPHEPDPDVAHRVLWPPGFRGEFSIFGWSGG